MEINKNITNANEFNARRLIRKDGVVTKAVIGGIALFGLLRMPEANIANAQVYFYNNPPVYIAPAPVYVPMPVYTPPIYVPAPVYITPAPMYMPMPIYTPPFYFGPPIFFFGGYGCFR